VKILQTPPRFYPYIGGVETYVYYLSRELAKRGHLVNITCADEPIGGSEEIDGIKVKRLKYACKIANTNITLGLPKALFNQDTDIIHTHLPCPWNADISAIISRLRKKPLFLTYHNDITATGANKLLAETYNFTFLKFLLNQARKIFVSTQNYLEYSVYLRPFLKKCIVAPLGVDLEKFKPLNLTKDNNGNNIFFLAKLDKFHRYKGLEYLLSSLKKIINRVPLKLYLGGEGDLMRYYKDCVRKLGLDSAVIFLGQLNQEESLRYYNLCDIFVFPSVSPSQEGFGLVALEAMACKKPVIITDIIGVALDVKREHAGIVVKPKNTEELSEAIKYLLLNTNEIKIMGENALKLVREKYSWQRHADIVEKEYLEAIE